MCVSPFVFRYITFGVHTNCSSYISCFLFLAKRDYSFSNCNLLKYSCSAPTFFDMDLWKNNVYTVLPKDFFVRVCTPSIFHCYYIFFLPLILYLLSCFFLHLYRTFFFWTPQLIWPLKNQTQWRYYFVPTYELHFSCAFFFFLHYYKNPSQESATSEVVPVLAVTNPKTLEEGDHLYSESFAQKSDEDEIPIPPNSTCKMRASCRSPATYKNSKYISCAQHATADMKPFNPANRKRKQVLEENDLEV